MKSKIPPKSEWKKISDKAWELNDVNLFNKWLIKKGYIIDEGVKNATSKQSKG